ncbi:MAG: substrate-binding domain-containing protein [Guyparkeria sp.]
MRSLESIFPPVVPFALLILLAVCPLGMVQADVAGVVAFAQDDMGNDWRRAQVEEVAEALGRHPGIDFRVSDARGRLPLQILQIEDWIAADVDVLITSPMDAEAMTPVLRRVKEAGIPLVLVDRQVREPIEDAFVLGDNRGIAREAGRAVVEALDGRGRVLMLEGVPGASTTVDRRRGFMDVLAQEEGISVESLAGNYLRGDTIRRVEALVEQEGGFRFDAVYSHSDSMLTGLYMALYELDIPADSLFTAGVDYIAEARERIRRGEQDLSFTYPTGGEEGAAIVVDLLRDRDVPARTVKSFEAVTRENVERVEPIF